MAMGPISDALDIESCRRLGVRLRTVCPTVRSERLIELVSPSLNGQRLMSRADTIARAIRDVLPGSFTESVRLLCHMLGPARPGGGYGPHENFELLPLTRFVSLYGLEYFEESMGALYEMTRRFTAEFDIRPFIERYPHRTLARFREWCEDPDLHVRRLVSEGTRPRLPWASHLQMFKRDPTLVLELLERLKDDPEPYVRRSVANNLADILKDNPAIAYRTLARWSKKAPPGRRWIIRHAVRFQRDRGDRRALELSGLTARPEVEVVSFRASPSRIKIGGTCRFSFRLRSCARQTQHLIVNYALTHKRNGQARMAKPYRLHVGQLDPEQIWTMDREHDCRPGATRRYRPGLYELAITVNGRTVASKSMRLV